MISPTRSIDRTRVRLRPAEPQDALCLGVLGLQVFLDTYATGGIRPSLAREALGEFSTEAFTALIGDGAVRVELAEYDDHLIGFSQTTLRAAHALAPPGVQSELVRLYVQEPFTRCGVGSALLRSAEALARQHGAQVLWLTPWVHNHRALRFYAAHGYSDCGATLFCFENEAHENRVVAKRLAHDDGRC